MHRVSRSPAFPRPAGIPRPSARALRYALFILFLDAGAVLAGNEAHASTPGSALLNDATARRYDIPAGPLGSALSAYAAQTGLLLVFDAALTRGLAVQPLAGRYTPRDALQRLLAGTGLEVLGRSDGSHALRAASSPSAGVESLAPVLVTADGPGNPQKDVYTAPRSSVYISSAGIDRFGRVSVGDLLKGQAGVQVGDSRNGGALDVNIRGIQGQSRVAVKVDGAEQALDVYRGYGGTQQRSYVDPALIGSVTIDKGPSLKSGAIGGTVDMRTIGVQDILVDGQTVGVRLTGDVWNNGVKAPYRNPEPGTSPGPEALLSQPRAERGGLFGSRANAGSAALAFTSERIDLVSAFAHRKQGNYFAGKRGQDRYRVYDDNPREGEARTEQKSVATSYNAGEEVLNSSSDVESVLLKTTMRPADGHTLEFGYRSYDGRIGEIMPSSIFRFGTAGIHQYPLGRTKVDTVTARYRYKPSGNDLVDFTTNVWTTSTQSTQLTAVDAPASQHYDSSSGRSWTRQAHRRLGGDLGNTSRFATAYGSFKLDVGGAFQLEDIRPQKSVLITQEDRDANAALTLRDATREELSLSAKLEYKPTDRLTLWAGGRFSQFRTKDRSTVATPRVEERLVRSLLVANDENLGWMDWYPDKHGQFSDATDPRLLNGIVYSDPADTSVGVPFNDFGASFVAEDEGRLVPVTTGFNYAKKLASKDSGFAPAVGINFELARDTFVYASYTEGLRLASLFETTRGALWTSPVEDLKPERSQSWELGASAVRTNMLLDADSASFKLAYFNNRIKNYVTRYADPTRSPDPSSAGDFMRFSNTDSYRSSGIELQSKYDAGRVFADLSATHYLTTRTCDAAFAGRLRAAANGNTKTGNTPDCTPGGFMGSYTNTQNPPKLAVNLTAGVRLFNEKLTVGTRVMYTSGPAAKADKPWQTGASTPQLVYHPVTVVDLFLNYKLREHVTLNVSLQNLTDRYYLDPLAQSFMPAPGRTLRVGLEAKF
jgi:hemoglobin/transferrin/lactoferrin receptor protein